jgi:hypothetical protein
VAFVRRPVRPARGTSVHGKDNRDTLPDGRSLVVWQALNIRAAVSQGPCDASRYIAELIVIR